MSSPAKLPSERRGFQAHYTRFLPNAFLGVALAFPLGIIIASIEAVSLFGTIVPISIFFGLILPIVLPLITIFSVLLASWHLVRFVARSLIGVGTTIAESAKELPLIPRVVHILSHAHEIAYMGIYGMLVILCVKPLATDPEVTNISPSFIRRQNRTRLFIRDFPKITIPFFPPTPQYSDPSYTPSRSPTCTESTDASVSLHTPADELSHTSLAQLSGLLDNLEDEELRIVASYVGILKRGRSRSFTECSGI